MVFASDIFILFMAVFLPLYMLTVRLWPKSAKGLLIAASLFFYSYWLPIYLFLFLASIAANFLIGRQLLLPLDSAVRRRWFAFGIAGNIGLIAYFKYAGFFLENLGLLLGQDFPVLKIALPLGISFFTFQQVSFLIDIYRGRLTDLNLWDYVLYVSFFPQLIAGPIVTQSEMLPQLKRKRSWGIRPDQFALGFFLFSVGLFKKVVLIDPYVPYVDIVYTHAATGAAVGFVDAWTAALGYSFQIYLDFSGYSDMAIGLALVFGLKLPINFFSPYKASSIREFWRRWHITLSHFLQHYLYIPFGGSRNGIARTIFALMGTMLLGGLWHGAGWQFILWGGLHGAFLVVNHVWLDIRSSARALKSIATHWLYRTLMVLVTFFTLTVTWVFFRADSVTAGLNIIYGMIGATSASSMNTVTRGIFPAFPLYFIFVWALPNSIQITRRFSVSLRPTQFRAQLIQRSRWTLTYRFTWFWAIASSTLFLWSWFSMSNLSPFIYFQF